jgi:hypothetical protein
MQMTIFHENYSELTAFTAELQLIFYGYKFYSWVPKEKRLKKVMAFEKSKILLFTHFRDVFVMILIYNDSYKILNLSVCKFSVKTGGPYTDRLRYPQ